MQNQLSITKLKRKFIILAIAIMFFLFIISIFITSLIQKSAISLIEKDFNTLIDNSIKHSIHHHSRRYQLLAKRIINVTKTKSFLEAQDKKGLFQYLNKKWLSFQKENIHLKALHFHNPDGTSFLRMHNPSKFGDNLLQTRKIIKEVHSKKVLITGLGTCNCKSMYRIIYPIFNGDRYLGALEIALDPRFIIDVIKEITDYKSCFFIKNSELKKKSKKNTIVIKDYSLQGDIYGSFQKKLKFIPKKYDFENNYYFKYQDKSYILHSFDIKNFEDKTKAKILIFQDITKTQQIKERMLIFFGIIVLFLLLFIPVLLNKQMNILAKSIKDIYENHAKELELSRLYLQMVFDTEPNITLTTYGEKIDRVNNALLNFMGYENVEEFKAKYDCICELFVKRDGYLYRDMNGVNWLDYIYANPKNRHKVVIIREQKEYIFYLSAKSFEFDSLHRSIVILNDITEIDILKTRYEFAIEGANDGLWDWNLKNDDFYCSPRCKEIYGFRDSDIKKGFVYMDRAIHPNDKNKLEMDLKENQEGKTKYYENIHRVRHQDGHWIWVEDRGKTIFDEKGEAVRMVGFQTDISEKKRAEMEMYRLQLAIEQSPIAIVITDTKANIIYANPWFSIVSGYRNDELIGQNPRVLKSEYTKEEDYLNLWEKLKNKESWNGTFKNIKKDGSVYWESSIITPILDSDGKIINYLGIKQEITEQVYLKEQLRDKEELMIAQSRQAAMGEMIGLIAHQWRQPLSTISANASNMYADIELEEVDLGSFTEQINSILEQTQYLSKTIDDFRNFFKPKKDKDLICVVDVMEECFNIVGKSLENNSIKVLKEFNSTSKITTYSRELQHVFINIIKNAKDALLEKGEENREIGIKIFDSINMIIVEICDNGGGVEKKIKDKIFEPYFSTKDDKNGTGLGLYMSKTILNKHLKGSISLKNSDKGACFTIKLPINTEEMKK